MKTRSLPFIILVVITISCTLSQPSTGAVQTAIAQTHVARLTAEPSVEQISPTHTVRSTTDPSVEKISPSPTINIPAPTTQPSAFATETSAPPNGVPQTVWSKPASSYAIADDTVYIESPNGRIQALDFITGAVVWSAEISGQIVCADSNNVYVSPSRQRIEAFDSFTGEPKWRALVNESLNVSSTMECILLHDSIFVSSESGYTRINRQTGAVLEPLPFKHVQSSGNILILNENIGWSPETGQNIWDLSEIASRPEICGRLLVYARRDTEANVIEAIDIDTGGTVFSTNLPYIISNIVCPKDELKKKFLDQGYLLGTALISGLAISPIFAPPYVEAESENIYITANTQFGSMPLIAINRISGEIQWLGPQSYPDIRPRGNDFNWLGEIRGKVFYSHAGFGLTSAFNMINHEDLWTNQQIVLSKLLGIADDTLVGILWDEQSLFHDYSTLIGLDIETGEEKWRLELGDINSIFANSNRLFYTLEDESTLWFIDPQSGALTAHLELVAERYGWPLILPYNEFILAVSPNQISLIKP